MGNCDFKQVVMEELFKWCLVRPTYFLCILHRVVVHYLTLRRCCSLYYSVLFMKAHGRTLPFGGTICTVGFLLSNWFLFIFHGTKNHVTDHVYILVQTTRELVLWHELGVLTLLLASSYLFYLVLAFVPIDSPTYFKFHSMLYLFW